MHPEQHNPPVIARKTLANLRRRVLPMASTAAALGLTGCSLWPFGEKAALEAPPQTAPPAAPQKTAQQVQAFTADLDTALQTVNRDTLTHPATRKSLPTQAITPADSANGEANASAASPPPCTASAPDRFLPSPLAPLGLAEFGQPSLWSAASPLFVPSLAPATISGIPSVSFDLTSPPAPLILATVTTTSSPPPPDPAGPAPPAVVPPSGRIQMLDGPPGVSVSTSLPGPDPLAASPIYTVYSPRKAPVTVSSPAEVTPALASAPEKPAEPSIDIALELIRRQAAAHPSLNTALALSLLDQSQGKPQNADIPRDLPAVDQQLLQDLASSLQSMAVPAAAGATLSERAAPLVEAARKWQAQADLKLPTLLLTSRVDSYGVYSPIDPKFPAGKKQTVIIYCEVANFVPKKTDDGWFETRLTQQETLATDDGLLLYRPNAEEVLDRSKNQRRDFYLVKKLTIPDNLAIGKYALRMSVTDLNTNKIAVVSLPIEIVK